MQHRFRVEKYERISDTLTNLSDKEIQQILDHAKPMHKGIGGKSVLTSVNDTPVFVKKVPLTDLEQLPQHFMSTANMFNLPMCYQYGVGSAGFGTWHELATHTMTTDWVITGACPHFPIMYHFRILPNDPPDLNTHYWNDIEGYCYNWGNSTTIRKRVEALNQSSMHMALFLEYVPHNLYAWLKTQISKGRRTAEEAIAFVDQNLTATNQFMNERGLMHFDAHFENILTDGKQLYLSDFGLALSSQFELSTTENEFLKQHQSYDQACAAVNLIHSVITSLFGKEQWQGRLREYFEGKTAIPHAIETVIKRYAPIALLMDEFFQKLQKESKHTPYPQAQLEELLNGLASQTS